MLFLLLPLYFRIKGVNIPGLLITNTLILLMPYELDCGCILCYSIALCSQSRRVVKCSVIGLARLLFGGTAFRCRSFS